MKIRSLIITLVISSTVMINISLHAQWQHDSNFGFKINIPPNWSKNSYMDGTDKVYDYMSPDENLAVQLRAFDANSGFTTALLAQVYEQNMLPSGTQTLSLNNHTTSNGIPCKKGVYLFSYNGNEIGMSALYFVENNKGYVLTSLIPSSMIQKKGDELKRVVQSFLIEGYSATANNIKEEKHSGLSGLMGGSTNNNSQNNNTNNDIQTNPTFVSGNLVYQGQTYRTVKIGNQVWMAENLNVGTMITKDKYPSDNGVVEKYCLFDDPENCKKFGGFYQFKEMMQYEDLNFDPNGAVITQGICPPGWHLPTDNEWKILEGTVDGKYGVGDPEWDKKDGNRGSDIGKALRSKSGWIEYKDGKNNNGNDNYGFAILAAGKSSSYGTHRPSSMGGNEMWGHFWTSTPNGGFLSFSRSFNYQGNSSRNLTGENHGLSVRCVKN